MFQQLFEITKTWFGRLKNRLEKLYVVGELRETDDIEEISRYLDEKDRRHYQQNGDDVYSVTTVLDKLEGEKWYLKKWKENNDGQGDNPYWKHILEYKQNRGTMAHYAALSRFREDLWSGDESSSLGEVYDRIDDPAFLYSIAADRAWVNTTDQFEILQNRENIGLDEIFYQDMDYFVEEFDKICREKGINSNTVENVEEMFVVPPNGEHNGYGGQVDLVYRDPITGGKVVADLKTSKNVYDKHKYQGAAYATALEKLEGEEVERAEIIRINPDQKEVEVQSFTDFDQYWSEFAETTKEM